MMLHSSHDMLALVADLNIRRIRDVYGARQKKAGGRLLLNDRQLLNMTNARRLRHRYLSGDYRHTEQECGRIFELCHQLIEWHCETHGGIPRHPQFQAQAMASKSPCHANDYAELMQKVAEI